MLKDQSWYRIQLEALYQRYCPDDAIVKSSKLDGLLDKYRGNEEELLLAVQQKYAPEPEGATRVISLGHFEGAPDGHPTDSYEALGLGPVRDALSRYAKELGGELKIRRWPAEGPGRLELVVCVPAALRTTGDTEAARALGKMGELTRSWHRAGRSKSTGLLLQAPGGEYERRQIEKERSQRKNGRQKSRGHRNNGAGLQR